MAEWNINFVVVCFPTVWVGMNTGGSKVKVWVRIRPSSNFAHDAIELLNDDKVCV